jgi:Thoeris protein ThsB, TIR-like domain
MARKVFHSFHYKKDSQRVQQVRNMGVIEGQRLLSANEWEQVKKGGDDAIRDWISKQMAGKSCAVVLIGSATAGRRWINYEIKKAWRDERGVLGVYIHNLKDLAGNQSTKGRNPFDDLTVNGTNLSTAVLTYNPPYSTSQYVYDHIKENLEDWIETAIERRKSYA